MIAGIFHQGSGLGNQLHRYVATRVLAEDKGYEWGMFDDSLFKGSGFMNLDFGKKASFVEGDFDWHYLDNRNPQWNEKKIVENGVDIRSYDPEFNFVEDNTIIDGEFQDERYFSHRLDDIANWLAVEPLNIPDDVCVIGFRGGEYAQFPDLYLTKEFWSEALVRMLKVNENMLFEIHTDDPARAQEMFKDLGVQATITHDIGLNWRSVRYAKHAIIANSSFFILPRLLAHREHIQNTSRSNPKGAVTIAPRYWARRNTKTWALPQNYYKQFTYI